MRIGPGRGFPGSTAPGTRKRPDKFRVRSTHWCEGRKLCQKSCLSTLQGEIAQPSLGQLPGCQKSVFSQVVQAGASHHISYEEERYVSSSTTNKVRSGINLHLKRTYVVLIDTEGEIIDQRRLLNTEMPAYLNQHVPHETFAVLEATRNWPFMYDLLSAHVERVELAHPKEVKAIANAAVKTDRIDVGVLAHLARLNYLPTAYAAPKEYRDLRLYTRHCSWLIKHRTQAKNRVQAVLAGYNLISPDVDLFGAKGREFLQEVREDLRPAAQKVIADNLRLIDQLNEQIGELEREIPLTEEQAENIKQLMSMPGIGTVSAMAILAEIGQIWRFKSAKSLCNWAGLTPRVRKSDAIVRHGKISKQGSAYLRSAMGQAAMVASRFSPRWYRVHERLVKRCGKRGAKVAVARRLLTVIYHILKNNQPYQEDYPGEPVELQGAQT